jgi:UbiD family decarboxylase
MLRGLERLAEEPFGGPRVSFRAQIVDEDVDLFDISDVLWEMQTRYQGDIDTVFLPGVTGHALDPSQTPE